MKIHTRFFDTFFSHFRLPGTQCFVFHFNVQKFVGEFLTGPQYLAILVIGFKEIGVVFIGTLSTFEKLDFPFHNSYCHMKIVPPMNTFDFFTLNCS